MRKRTVAFAAVALLVLTAALTACGTTGLTGAQAQQTDSQAPERTITVTGTGQVSGAPDIAHITLGVQTMDPSAQAALQTNSQQMTAVIAAIKAQGVADTDIQTSNFSIYAEQPTPTKVPSSGATQSTEVIYHVSNQVNVTVRDLTKLGDILDQAVGAGANSAFGISFDVKDPTSLEDAARELAVADAKARADNLAKLAGVTLGQVMMVSESGGGPGPIYRAAALDMAGATPIQAGELQVSLAVQVVYAIQ
jgi:uncharacterized protein YggE